MIHTCNVQEELSSLSFIDLLKSMDDDTALDLLSGDFSAPPKPCPPVATTKPEDRKKVAQKTKSTQDAASPAR